MDETASVATAFFLPLLLLLMKMMLKLIGVDELWSSLRCEITRFAESPSFRLLLDSAYSSTLCF